ncbi:tyrosinase cofactor [Streptomyces sp. NBC_00096]|uniref:apotyrosinase chaperone MelC1 n=1 Tax=Streptomyces sp. NBC_00096 TaxID=2975650 RepID=UPI0032445F76
MKKITRRQALGSTVGALAALGLAGATAHAAVTGSRPAEPATPAGTIDEVYQGRHIRITPAATGMDHHTGHHAGHDMTGMPTVLIDGRALHVMQNADGTWISVVNHYETFADPLPLARAAVRELQGADLVPMAGM